MNLISIDLEMNKPSNKIIQLGYVIFNVKTQKILIKRCLYIDPKETLNPEITKLTRITELDILYNSISLQEAYTFMITDMEKYQTNKHPVQWGLDHFELRNQLNITWDDYIFRRRGHDIKSLYQVWAMIKEQMSSIAGLGRAMKQLGLEFEGQEHNALDDAYNTMRVLFEIQNKLSNYEKIKKVMIK